MGEKVRAWGKVLRTDDGLVITMPEYGIWVVDNSFDGLLEKASNELAKEAKIRIASGEQLPKPIMVTNNQTLGGMWIEAEI